MIQVSGLGLATTFLELRKEWRLRAVTWAVVARNLLEAAGEFLVTIGPLYI